MKKEVKSHDLTRISAKMAKKFGRIPKGSEEEFSMLLYPIERNLLKIGYKENNKNGRRIDEAVKICLLTIDGYLNGWEYDFDKYLTAENTGFVYAILMAIDPFTNPELKDAARNYWDFDDLESLTEFFGPSVKCLLRIEDSIKLWLRKMGVNGYFSTLERFIPEVDEEDDKMHFTARVPGTRFG